ncbi:hypothetical protein RDV89_12815 [Nocardioides zeae]|uniref:Uncharacterized protein n=1 Tax=Nocardioides imazamoxiresistens TaxID=3231893 RepID=A0ABU3PXP6_9ACTN|nr:hypothetical protein [Nocardioides zeae]MDT9593956.1 hypothetical protein [Nocardioides zeae]
MVPPAMVRCNRGLGRWFWFCVGIIVSVTAIAVVASGEAPWVMALTGLGVAALFLLARALLPPLTLSPAERVIRTRGRVVPYAAVAAVDFPPPDKAGVWAGFLGDDGRRLARLAIDETLMAPATVEQWAAVQQLVALGAAPGPASHAVAGQPLGGRRRPAGRSRPMGPAEAVAVLDAQVAWCAAGNRPGHRHAPVRALLGRVALR